MKEVLSDFEYRLELFSIDREIPPPPGAREQIEARLREVSAVRRPQRRGEYRRERSSGPSSDYIRVDSSSSTHIWVHKNWRVWFIVFCIISKIFVALSVYYFVEYRHAQQQIRQLQEQLGKRGGSGSEAK